MRSGRCLVEIVGVRVVVPRLIGAILLRILAMVERHPVALGPAPINVGRTRVADSVHAVAVGPLVNGMRLP